MLGLDTLWFQPDGLSLEAASMLVLASAITSMVTAAAGVGGGVLLFAIMAWQLPITALIPVHGLVQIGSNAGRLLLLLRNVRLEVILPFFIGSVVGGAIGAFVVIELPPVILQLGLGVFILWSAWGKPPEIAADRRVVTLTGFFSTFLTMFFGATGTFVASMVKLLRLDRLPHVATHSACMTAQHGIKVLAFGFLGFAYAPYLPLILTMIGVGFVGTFIGNRFLHRMANRRFHLLVSCVLTILALGLLAEGAKALVATKDVVSVSHESQQQEADAVTTLHEYDRQDEYDRRVAVLEADYSQLLEQLHDTNQRLANVLDRVEQSELEQKELRVEIEHYQRRIEALKSDTDAFRVTIANAILDDRSANVGSKARRAEFGWIRSLVDHHRLYAGSSVKINVTAQEEAESGTLTNWFKESMGRDIAIPNLSKFGLVFIGGRVVFIGDQPTGQIAYTDIRKNQRVDLWLTPGRDQLGTIAFDQHDDLTVAHWQSHGWEHALIGRAAQIYMAAIAVNLHEAHSE